MIGYISKNKADWLFQEIFCDEEYCGGSCYKCGKEAQYRNKLLQEPDADVQPINSLVKVEERVPDVSGNYLCYLANGEFDVLYFDRGIEDDMYNNDYPFGVWNTYPSNDGGECREWIEVLEVTHWQPLPESPKEG